MYMYNGCLQSMGTQYLGKTVSVKRYQEVQWYFLVRDGAGSKWPPVYTFTETFFMKNNASEYM